MRLVILPGVGRERDGFGLDVSVDIDGVKRGGRDGLGGQAGTDSELEHEFTPCLADALAKARHLGVVNRQPVLKILFSAKVLPVRILDPAGDDERVGEFEGVLEVVQADYEADGHAGPAHRVDIPRAKLGDGGGPIDLTGQLHQGML